MTIEDIITQHAEDAAFLWLLRDSAVYEPHYDLKDLAELDNRVEAHLDGLRIAGDVGWEICKDALSYQEPGEAFSIITGLDLAYEDLEGEWPEGFVAGPSEDPKDEDVDLDPDEDLPWPAPTLITQWWGANQGRFSIGTRYLAGQPIAADHLRQVLVTGFQRQRVAAAMELALLRPEQPLFAVQGTGVPAAGTARAIKRLLMQLNEHPYSDKQISA
ncbi:MAG: hypothetical protein WGN25_03685 [Candidatus Electrothrix sp. GW3-4]|uniref:hypothetical protein n=1 Tax=Candidatus Electrothrix sp. GW3-4 TaxID=3126740 RepID=UPI0030CB24AC